ncbi:MAG: lipoprotein [Burkholderiaceae bacterium]|jgi:predicted small lipoprotein YifL|nr:lipoprotein [Burkholderiaceae bacterium]
MNSKKLASFVIAIMLLSGLSACGQKGPLVLPNKPAIKTAPPSSQVSEKNNDVSDKK